ncbi:MAG: CcmD family protein [bacterium]|nr:CcmD family protein [bacterium]
MNYLYAAYTVIWLILFIYMFSINKKQNELMKEIDHLKQKLEERT